MHGISFMNALAIFADGNMHFKDCVLFRNGFSLNHCNPPVSTTAWGYSIWKHIALERNIHAINVSLALSQQLNYTVCIVCVTKLLHSYAEN